VILYGILFLTVERADSEPSSDDENRGKTGILFFSPLSLMKLLYVDGRIYR
jgi:hypothetical protein